MHLVDPIQFLGTEQRRNLVLQDGTGFETNQEMMLRVLVPAGRLVDLDYQVGLTPNRAMEMKIPP